MYRGEIMTTLLLVRHGYSLSNESGTFTGQTDVPLTEEGVRQAELTARYLAGNYQVDKILSGDLIRTVQTAKPLSELTKLPILKEKGLREIYGGKWEGKKAEEISSLYPADYERWKNDVGNSCPTGGESVKEVQVRAVKEIERIAFENEGKTVAVFTHACFIRAAECYYEGLPLSGMKNIPWVKNASVTELFFAGGKFSMGKIGYAEQLNSLVTSISKGF